MFWRQIHLTCSIDTCLHEHAWANMEVSGRDTWVRVPYGRTGNSYLYPPVTRETRGPNATGLVSSKFYFSLSPFLPNTTPYFRLILLSSFFIRSSPLMSFLFRARKTFSLSQRKCATSSFSLLSLSPFYTGLVQSSCFPFLFRTKQF